VRHRYDGETSELFLVLGTAIVGVSNRLLSHFTMMRDQPLGGRGSDTEPKCRVDPNDGCAACDERD
jgi:hypothetical protein